MIQKNILNPLPNPAAVVQRSGVRFTVLTSRLIRLEWAEDGAFQDQASFVFLHRHLPTPEFTVTTAEGWLEIRTSHLTLRYREASGAFSAENLSIHFSLNGQTVTWRPGTPDVQNLRGTTRTLDRVKGATSLEEGILSRAGWTLIDDSERPLFDHADWPWVQSRPQKVAYDWYFFGYGHAYKEALGDFVRVAGRIPLPPRYAFGAWWSRYWPDTDQELKELVEEFERYDVPLDVLVVDMDWTSTLRSSG